MTDYGQSITRKWYVDTTARQVTKMNLAWHLHRAFLTVGMQPIRSWNPFDLELASNAEYDVGTVGRSDLIWFYDYPTSETFDINGIAYRPCLALYIPIPAVGTNQTSTTAVDECLFITHGYRPSVNPVKNDFMTLCRLARVSTNAGFGSFNESAAFNSSTDYGTLTGLGSAARVTNWKTWGGSASAFQTTLLSIRNIQVLLGYAGLIIQVGSGNSKTDNNDIFNVTFGFGGARIPGRARIPASDPNLNRINPVIPLPHIEATASTPPMWVESSLVFGDVTLTGVRAHSYALGCQQDLKIAYSTIAGFTTRPGPVQLKIFNLENIERPLFPSASAATLNSPRPYNGGGAHILQPIVYVQAASYANSSDYYGVQDFNVRSELTPTWQDVWYFPKLRFADRVAPAGEYTDPVTSVNWFLYRAANINTMMAAEVVGMTKFTAFNVSTTFSALANRYFNLNGGFTWTVGNPAAAVASTTAGTAWTATPATDEATVTVLAASGVSTLTFVAEPFTNELQSTYTLQLDIKWNSVTAQTASQNALNLQYSTDNGTTWVTMLSIFNTGNAAVPYNAYTATAELPIVPSALDNRIRFRVDLLFSSGTGGNRTAAIRNIRIRRYERV